MAGRIVILQSSVFCNCQNPKGPGSYAFFCFCHPMTTSTRTLAPAAWTGIFWSGVCSGKCCGKVWLDAWTGIVWQDICGGCLPQGGG